MIINSNKETNDPTQLQQLWWSIKKYFISMSIFIIFSVILYLYIPNDYLYIFISSVVLALIVGAITNGMAIDDFKDFMSIINLFMFIVGGFVCLNMPLETEKESMDIKPFIKTFQVNQEGDRFTLNLKLPFESIDEFTLSNSSFNKLFAAKSHFNEFNITIEKECNRYRIKGVSCHNKLYIYHKDVGGNIYNISMNKSIYPKKFKMEND